MCNAPEQPVSGPDEQNPGPAQRTYSYDPGKLMSAGVDRLRFELGDTTLAPGELTAALCDEEYRAALDQGGGWEAVKLRCLRAIVMRFAHQATMSVDGLRYDFGDRAAVWRAMLKEAEKKCRTLPSMPKGGGAEPYFYRGMLENPRKR